MDCNMNCNMNCNKNCNNDSDSMVVGMCYVPWQKWCGLYSLDVAILKGTLFTSLDKPFLGGCR